MGVRSQTKKEEDKDEKRVLWKKGDYSIQADCDLGNAGHGGYKLDDVWTDTATYGSTATTYGSTATAYGSGEGGH
jgi:hypothetical protein